MADILEPARRPFEQQVLSDMRSVRSPLVIDAIDGATPEQIDQVIAQYDSANRMRLCADEIEAEAKNALIQVIRLCGYPTPHAERSHTVSGSLSTATMTTSTKITIHEPAVMELRALLCGAGREDIFVRLFVQRVKHELASEASEAIKTVNLPRRMQEKVQAAYGMCFTPADTAPRVKTDVLVKEPKPRKSAAKKLAVQG